MSNASWYDEQDDGENEVTGLRIRHPTAPSAEDLTVMTDGDYEHLFLCEKRVTQKVLKTRKKEQKRAAKEAAILIG